MSRPMTGEVCGQCLIQQLVLDTADVATRSPLRPFTRWRVVRYIHSRGLSSLSCLSLFLSSLSLLKTCVVYRLSSKARLGQLELSATTAALAVAAGCSPNPLIEMQPSPQLLRLRHANEALLTELAALLTGGKRMQQLHHTSSQADPARTPATPDRENGNTGESSGGGVGGGGGGGSGGGGGGGGSAMGELRPKFGARQLSAADNVFAHNAWDNVVQTPEQMAQARQKVLEQAEHPVKDEYGKEVKHKASGNSHTPVPESLPCDLDGTLPAHADMRSSFNNAVHLQGVVVLGSFLQQARE